jgi:hypothetical protein
VTGLATRNHAAIGKRYLNLQGEPRRDVALAEAFLRVSRTEHAVVAVNEQVVMATSGVAAFVTAADQGALWSWARAQWTGSGILRLDGRPAVDARCVPVHCGPRLAGALVTLATNSVPERERTGADSCGEGLFESVLPGASALVRHTRTQLEVFARQRASTLITGEPGTGKAVAGRHLLAQGNGEICEFDASCSVPESWIADVAAALRGPARVLLTHLDEVAPRAIPALARALREHHPDRWVVATAAQAGVPASLADAFPNTIMLPALRERLEDLPAISAHLLRRRSSRGRDKRLGPEARRLLWSHSWPSNISELDLVLGRAAVLAPTAVIDAHCIRLPRDAGAPGRRRSAVEAAERFSLLDALDRCDGNKLAAADLLGIARSTLYRKLHVLGITAEVDGATVAAATA